MDEAQLVVLIGHPTPSSRTHGVAHQAGTRLSQAFAAAGLRFAAPAVVDLAELAPILLDRQDCGGPAGRALHTVSRATLLVAVSPTFRAAYSGLLKLFLDLLPRNGLAGTVALPLMTAGLPAHSSVGDRTLRPILQELRANVPAAGLCVLETQLTRFDDVFEAWWSAQGQALVNAVRSRPDGGVDGFNGRESDDAQRCGALAGRPGGGLPA
jgi:FMN reductase